MTIRSGTEADFDAIRHLLEADALPTSDLSPQSMGDFLVVSTSDEIVGCVGLERHETLGLLRSLVVARSERGKQLGKHLTDAALKRAQQRNIETVFLLTNTARDFFANRGFEVVDRRDVPNAIRGTSEFSSLCPASATVMARRT